MWKFLEQKSFHLTEEQYEEQLDAVAEMVQQWGVSDTVRAGIASGRSRGPGFTAGGSARAVSASSNKQTHLTLYSVQNSTV